MFRRWATRGLKLKSSSMMTPDDYENSTLVPREKDVALNHQGCRKLAIACVAGVVVSVAAGCGATSARMTQHRTAMHVTVKELAASFAGSGATRYQLLSAVDQRSTILAYAGVITAHVLWGHGRATDLQTMGTPDLRRIDYQNVVFLYRNSQRNRALIREVVQRLRAHRSN